MGELAPQIIRSNKTERQVSVHDAIFDPPIQNLQQLQTTVVEKRANYNSEVT